MMPSVSKSSISGRRLLTYLARLPRTGLLPSGAPPHTDGWWLT